MTALESTKSLSHTAEAAAWTFTGLSTGLFIIRLISRFHILRQPMGWDDVIVIISWILAVCRAIFFQIALSAIRRIELFNPASTIPNAAFWIFFTEHWTFLSVALPKCAIALLIVGLFNPRPLIRVIIFGLCIYICGLAIVGFFASTLNCTPVAYQWNPYAYKTGHCWSQVAVNILGGIFSIFSALIDLVFAVYPGFVIWRLQMSTFKRLSTMALMGLGLASFTFATVKVVCMLELKGRYPSIERRIWYGMLISFWCSLENDFILGAACLPLTPPFFRCLYRACKKHSESCKFRNRLKYSSYKLKNSPSHSSNTKVLAS